jgi:hypothetical protein
MWKIMNIPVLIAIIAASPYFLGIAQSLSLFDYVFDLMSGVEIYYYYYYYYYYY